MLLKVLDNSSQDRLLLIKDHCQFMQYQKKKIESRRKSKNEDFTCITIITECHSKIHEMNRQIKSLPE